MQDTLGKIIEEGDRVLIVCGEGTVEALYVREVSEKDDAATLTLHADSYPLHEDGMFLLGPEYGIDGARFRKRANTSSPYTADTVADVKEVLTFLYTKAGDAS